VRIIKKAGRAKSCRFRQQNNIALKEARETHYWLRILIGSNEFAANLLSDLLDECEQIKRILGAIVGRCKQKDRKARTPAAE
jgi:four helix bundle protein